MSDEIKDRIERIYQTKLAKYKDDIPDEEFKLILWEEAKNEVMHSMEFEKRNKDKVTIF